MSKVQLYIRKDIGKGKLVILLHGLFGDGTQWNKITDILVKSGHRVVVLDLLGHGRSPKPIGAKFNAKENVQALRASLEKINATADATVVGYSMGGAVALSYCAKYPLGASNLIIISTPFYLKPDQMLTSKYALSVFITKMTSRFFTTVNKLFISDRILAKMAHYADTSDKFHAMIGANDGTQDPRVIRNSIANLIQNYNFASELEKIKIPVSFYCGKKDPFIVQNQLYALKQFNSYMHIQRLDVIKVDHMLVQNLPKEIVSIITKDDANLLNIHTDTKLGEPLILLHGIESSSSYWNGVINPLAENNRVITIDLLGYGQSPKPNNIAYSTDQHVEYLHRTIKTLNIKKFRIAAHSLGSIIALAYASKYPGEVSGLFLFAPVLTQDTHTSNKFLIKNINLLSAISDTGKLHPEIARAIGDKRLAQIIPTIRTTQNTIYSQTPISWVGSIKNIPVVFAYGTFDSLVDGNTVTEISKIGSKNKVVELNGMGHNFVLSHPQTIIDIIEPSIIHNAKPKKSSLIPVNYFKHIASLTIPNLVLKSLAYILAGILIFTPLVIPAVTIGFAVVVINKSYKIIRGAFSLRNEGLAYISYVFLSAFIALVGFGLIRHPQVSFKIAAYSIATLVFVAGALRIIAAVAWTKQQALKSTLIISGTLMLLLGLGALLGGVVSAYIIAYSIAIYLIGRGLLYGFYATSITFFAFIRGYIKT